MPLIVFFDGYCGLCSFAVDFILVRDKKSKFKFSPLQGEYIKSLNIKVDINQLDTIYVYDGTNFYCKAEAVRLIGLNLGGTWKLLTYLSYLLPLFFCNWIYDVISKNRYRVFGRRDSCRLPTSAEAPKFLL